MNASQVFFSVLIPVYNAEKYLEKCLGSLLGQTYKNWEAILIDDCSTDSSSDLLCSYSNIDPRIKMYRNEINEGPGKTRNKAIEYATEHSLKIDEKHYVVFIDSDDWIEKDYLKLIANKAYSENSDAIYVDIIQEDEQGNKLKHQKLSNYENKGKNKLIRHQMTGKAPWGGVRKVVNVNLLTLYNIRYTDDDIGEEAIYSFKVLYYANKISFLRESFYHYVIHKDSQSSVYNENPYGEVCKKLKFLLQEKGIYSKYKYAHTSFAFTSLIVSIYRVASYYEYNKALLKSKAIIHDYKKNYDLKLDKDCLDSRVRLMLPFAKANLIIPILLISKIKAKIKKVVE